VTLAVVTEAAAMTALAEGWRGEGRSVGLVATMGALHRGHAALMERARAECERVVLSVFVNPRQFGPGEDLSRYPRALEADLALAREAGVDVAFTPDGKEVYPEGFATAVQVGALGDVLCGAARPGHFDGVATVVTRLFGLTRPTRAYFGHKDYQQCVIVRRVAADLALGVEIVVCPTVREADGLALSSRNAYLTPADRERARAVPEALRAGAERFAAGDTDPEPVLAAVRAVLEGGADRIDYVEAVDPDTLAPVTRLAPGTVLLVAAHVGAARLIDNRVLSTAADPSA
jgi:pantoate--beta-alanine ligase